MIQVHPRDYTMGFGGFLQGKFGGTGAGAKGAAGFHGDRLGHSGGRVIRADALEDPCLMPPSPLLL